MTPDLTRPIEAAARASATQTGLDYDKISPAWQLSYREAVRPIVTAAITTYEQDRTLTQAAHKSDLTCLHCGDEGVRMGHRCEP